MSRPQFTFEADAGLSSGTDAAGSSAIRAAFAAFHQKTSAREGVRPSAVQFLRGGGWAFVVLAVIGFGGGLFLAGVSFSGPESTVSVAGVAPEIMYARPVSERGDEDARSSTAPAEPRAVVLSTAGEAASPRTDASQSATTSVAQFETELVPAGLIAQTPLPASTANFAAAMRLGAIGHGAQNGTGDASHTGSDALELSSVPEPGSGLMIAICLAAMIALHQFVGRRRPSRPDGA